MPSVPEVQEEVKEKKPRVKKEKEVAEKKVEKKVEKNVEKKAGKELTEQCLSFMRKGKEYTTREIVEGLGRTPGNKEGGPVILALHRLVEEKAVKNTPNEGKRGMSWVKL